MALVAAGDFETDAALWARAVSVAAMIIISRTICFTVKSYYFRVLERVKVCWVSSCTFVSSVVEVSEGGLSANMHHRPRCGHEIWLPDVVAFFLPLHYTADELNQFVVGSAAAH